MNAWFGSRSSLTAAILFLWFGPIFGLHGLLAPLLPLGALALVWRFWRIEAAGGLDTAYLAADPGARGKLAPLLSQLRARALLVAAGTFFATVFLIVFATNMLGADLTGNFLYALWVGPFEAVGIDAMPDNTYRLLIPLTIATSVGFPILAILSVLAATLLGGSAPIPRTALLRPFGERRMTRALKHVVARRLGKVGFVYTLSDKHYKPNPLVVIVTGLWSFSEYILGPIFRPSIRYMNVHSRDMLDDLKAAMRRRMSPSWRTALSGNQALNIKATDELWQEVVDVLLGSTDFVVMDVSKVGAGSAWEIERLFALDLAPRCIFIAQEGHEESARAAIAEGARGGALPLLHVFRSDGVFLDEGAFQRELGHRLLETLNARATAYSAAPA